MPAPVEAAYKDAVENIIFLKKQQWMATSYALLVYAAIFVISGRYFSRTDFARNTLGIVTLVTFVIHWYMIYVFKRGIDRFRRRLDWVYQTYFSQEERVGLDLPLGPTADREQWEVSTALWLVSLVGAVFTAIYLWSVRT
jgi:cobalamin synthase